MNVLVDENLPEAAARWLVQQGHDAWHVRELGLAGRPDRDIWGAAQALNAIILTRDDDFVACARDDNARGVVLLNLGNCSNEVLIARLAALWSEIEARIEGGECLIEIG